MRAKNTVLAILTAVGVFTEAKEMNGDLDSVTMINNTTQECTFWMNGEESPTIKSSRICKMLQQAVHNLQPVCVNIIAYDSYIIYFLGHESHWAGEKIEKESFQYQLVGKVNNVLYNSQLNRCYVAVDIGYYNVRNNNVYHATDDQNLCDRAIEAFYNEKTVTMIAKVDLIKGYANDILVLIVG